MALSQQKTLVEEFCCHHKASQVTAAACSLASCPHSFPYNPFSALQLEGDFPLLNQTVPPMKASNGLPLRLRTKPESGASSEGPSSCLLHHFLPLSSCSVPADHTGPRSCFWNIPILFSPQSLCVSWSLCLGSFFPPTLQSWLCLAIQKAAQASPLREAFCKASSGTTALFHQPPGSQCF